MYLCAWNVPFLCTFILYLYDISIYLYMLVKKMFHKVVFISSSLMYYETLQNTSCFLI